MTNQSVTLGCPPEIEGDRDAIHIAVIAMPVNNRYAPGERVGVTRSGELSKHPPFVGVIDPFLTDMVNPGDRVWLCLFPNTITGLRHRWTHPAFPFVVEKVKEKYDDAQKEASKRYLQQFAEDADIAYPELLRILEDFLDTGNLHVQYDETNLRDHFYDKDADEFWLHVAVVLEDDRALSEEGSPFTCSC